MVRRSLSGRLENLAPTTLLRLISATSPSGVLEVDTNRGLLRLEVDRGRVPLPSPEKLKIAREVLASRSGEFRFLPCEVHHAGSEVLSLAEFAEAADPVRRGSGPVHAADPSAAGEGVASEGPKIHVLPSAPLLDPLDDLLSDLEFEVSSQLLAAEVGVVAEDPQRGLYETASSAVDVQLKFDACARRQRCRERRGVGGKR